MAKIQSFLYCESIQQNPNGTLSINGPMQEISPAYIPGMFSFSIFLSLIAMAPDKAHTIQFKFDKKTEGTDIQSKEKTLIDTGLMTLPVQENNKQANNMMANMELRNVPLEFEGEYETGVWFDSEFVGSYSIIVKKRENV